MRQLTEKQQKFLDVLFSEAQGNMATAIKLAGYAEHTTPSQIVKALKEEIIKCLLRLGKKAKREPKIKRGVKSRILKKDS